MKRARGFTLLEVMVAISILAAALAVILRAHTRTIAMSNHARMMTTATMLVRAELVRLEDDLDEHGFPEQDDDRSGTFAEDGFPQFRWDAHIEKIELPSNLGDQATKAATGQQSDAIEKAAGASAGGFNPTSGGVGGAASMILSQFEMIRSAIEQSIRKVTVRVIWNEGRLERSIDAETFFTDASKVDQALPGLGALGPGATPTPGAPRPPGTGGTGGGTPGTGGTGGRN